MLSSYSGSWLQTPDSDLYGGNAGLPCNHKPHTNLALELVSGQFQTIIATVNVTMVSPLWCFAVLDNASLFTIRKWFLMAVESFCPIFFCHVCKLSLCKSYTAWNVGKRHNNLTKCNKHLPNWFWNFQTSRSVNPFILSIYKKTLVCFIDFFINKSTEFLQAVKSMNILLTVYINAAMA